MEKSKQKNTSSSYNIKIVTSDITYMKDTFCVAGWSPTTSEMKRLMIEGGHWSKNDLKKIGKYSLLEVGVVPKQGGRNFPHKTEDTWIEKDFRVIHRYDNPRFLVKELKFSASRNIQDAFKGNLRENSYVPFKTECPSLGAIILNAENIKFFRKDKKLRVQITDSDNQEYDLRVTCKYLRDMLDPYSEKEFMKFGEEMNHSGSLAHVRVGLAKPYVYKDSNCYLMCNGVFFYNE